MNECFTKIKKYDLIKIIEKLEEPLKDNLKPCEVIAIKADGKEQKNRHYSDYKIINNTLVLFEYWHSVNSTGIATKRIIFLDEICELFISLQKDD